MPDGSEPRSGTDYELAWAKAQRKKTPGIPAFHVYRNRSKPNPPLDAPENSKNSFGNGRRSKSFSSPGEKTARASSSVHSTIIRTSKSSSVYFASISVIFFPLKYPANANAN
jgi:hypothetical protein